MKDDEWGYFGKCLDGYMHYNQFMTHDRQMLDKPSGRRYSRQWNSGDKTSWKLWAILIGFSVLGFIIHFLSV